MYLDSVDKIVNSYFAAFAAEPFEYKGVRHAPKTLHISTSIVKGYTCPPGCGACCMKFSLDYLSTEPHPYGGLEMRRVMFDGRQHIIWSDLQRDNKGRLCRNLQPEDARCGIHLTHPFSCDFELLKVKIYSAPGRDNQTGQSLYNRRSLMRKLDGSRGTLCTIEPVTDASIKDSQRRLTRLAQWMVYFGMNPTRVWDAVDVIGRGAMHLPVKIPVPGEGFAA